MGGEVSYEEVVTSNGKNTLPRDTWEAAVRRISGVTAIDLLSADVQRALLRGWHDQLPASMTAGEIVGIINMARSRQMRGEA